MPLLMNPILWAVLLIYFLFFREKKISLDQFVKPTEDNPDALNYYGTRATISQAKATSIASKLKKEMGSSFTSESAVLGYLVGLNEADYILVYQKFGYYKRDLVAPGSAFLVGTDYDLTEWLTLEITSSANKQKLKNQFPNIF